MNDTWQVKIKSALWAMFLMLLGAFFVFVVMEAGGYQKIATTEIPLKAQAMSVDVKKEEPKYYFAKNPKIKPKISATAYVVGDLSTGKIILAKNQNEKFPIASISKLMTAVVAKAVEQTPAPIKISQKALDTEGKNGDLRANETIKSTEILYPLLLESSNDAAEAIAEHYGRDYFLEKMNAEAKNLGLASTSFLDPSGLSPSNISTAFDLFNFANFIKTEKPELLQITKNKTYSNSIHNWFSNNQFLRTAGYEGGKSGYTDEAMQTVVSFFSVKLGEEEPHPIAITLLRSKDRFKDVQNIVKYLQSNIYYGYEKDANLAWKKQGASESDDKEPSFVTLSFLGDIMLDRGVRNSVTKNFGGDYSALFENLGMLHESDIVFGNLEGTASDKGKDAGSLYSFQMDPSVVPALKGAGISVLSVANNHVADWGRESYVDTLERLKENEILYIGGGMTEYEAAQPIIIEKQGIKVGFLGFSDKGPEWMKATGTQAGPLMANNPHFASIIKNASEKVDYLIVSFHFGEEYQKVHDERQESLAHSAIDNGARIVVGHHPHVIQDTEVYRNGYIIYSLGNAIFDQTFSADTMQGMMVEMTLDEDGAMTAKKDIVKLNRVFQPDQVIEGKKENLKFEKAEIIQ